MKNLISQGFNLIFVQSFLTDYVFVVRWISCNERALPQQPENIRMREAGPLRKGLDSI
jgi:hypothetical protein